LSNSKPKIAYILPFYEEDTDTHLFYNYELIKKVAARKEEDLFIILEKKTRSDAKQLGAPYYVQKFSFPPLRFLELLWKCAILCWHGYRNFYIHYSYYGAISAWWLKASEGFYPTIKIFYWNRGMPWLFKRNRLEEGVFKFILRHVILVTGPESLAEKYQKHYGVKEYRVLSNWVDVARFAPAQTRRTAQGLEKLALESADKRIILFVHHLSKRKGADLIPEISKGFGGDVLFLVAGDGPEKENLEKLGLSNMKILGKVPNSEIPKYMQMADVFLMPSREEGSPHVLLEAMASGMPFVASDVGGVRELIPSGAGQFLCKSEDVKCFQNKLKTLLADKALYDNARKIGLEHAVKFDISRGVEEFTGLFK